MVPFDKTLHKLSKTTPQAAELLQLAGHVVGNEEASDPVFGVVEERSSGVSGT